MISQVSKRGNRVIGIQILRRAQHLEKADLIPRRAIEVRYNVLRRIVQSLSELTAESEDRTQMPTLVMEEWRHGKRLTTEQRSGWR